MTTKKQRPKQGNDLPKVTSKDSAVSVQSAEMGRPWALA